MKRLRFHYVLSVLFLLLPGKVASKKGGGNQSDNVTVGILVCVLLLLLLLLFLAWQRLNRESEGRYHPQRLMRSLVFRVRQFWQEMLNEEQLPDDLDKNQQDEELGEQQPNFAEDEEQLLQQEDSELEEEKKEEEKKEEEKEEEEEEKQEVPPPETTGTESPTGTVVEMAPGEDGASRATESSAGTLLSDLHSFSGTAAWEDPGKPMHVTAL